MTPSTIYSINNFFNFKAEWIVWPTAQVINFWILPSRFRVLYDNTISLGYDVYTSYVINEPIPNLQSTNEASLTIISNSNSIVQQQS